jgi:hypothetical protein
MLIVKIETFFGQAYMIELVAGQNHERNNAIALYKVGS